MSMSVNEDRPTVGHVGLIDCVVDGPRRAGWSSEVEPDGLLAELHEHLCHWGDRVAAVSVNEDHVWTCTGGMSAADRALMLEVARA